MAGSFPGWVGCVQNRTDSGPDWCGVLPPRTDQDPNLGLVVGIEPGPGLSLRLERAEVLVLSTAVLEAGQGPVDLVDGPAVDVARHLRHLLANRDPQRL